jgi:Domain of unknown function (DUF5916)/Carbohydrate family 9 binding domain-like
LLPVLMLAIFLPAISAALPQAVPSAGSASQSQSETPPAPERLAVAADQANNLVIPRLPQAPTLEDFLTMSPQGEAALRMAKVTRFLQREPRDGEPATEPTEAYLGYDEKNLYVVFVCHDDPAKVRAHETRREDFNGEDDDVEVMLDTFHDRRRAYVFLVNPKGIQWDAIWTEASFADTGGNFDTSFDTLWYSKGKVTGQGYVVWIAIPFRSLRFPSAQDQTWGVVLLREIIRNNEKAFWPHISINQEGRLGQAATVKGLSGISPGHNIQLIPYGLMNSFHSVDDRGPAAPCPTPSDPSRTCARFQNRAIGGTFGVDGKVIFNDSLVLDATANPDFSQVESDEPQVTVNQRFRVFFPEKRPFFIENADYFRTPIDLFFTRNIVDPSAGIRLTGKAGPYSLGVLSSDDRAPGLTVDPTTPLFKTRSYFTIARASRDIFKQSSIGAIYTDWEYPAANSFNRVGGIDSRIKFSSKLTGTFQAVTSSTQFDTIHSAGPAYKADLTYTSRHWFQESTYNDVSPGFFTQPGFVNRVDLREYRDDTAYMFRPKSGPVVNWGPEFFGHWTWDHTGLRLDTDYNPSFNLVLKRQTRIFLLPYEESRERLRPQDFPALCQNNICRDLDFHEHSSGISVSTSPLSQITLGANYFWGNAINFVPGFFSPCPAPPNPCLQPPSLARSDLAGAVATIHPFTQLKIDNTYLFSRLRTRDTNANIFNNHILRSKWNWQFTRELSLRVILQYNATLTQNKPGDPANTFPLTFLQTTKNFNTDILITYLLHPGTAVYVGYNSNLQNLDPALAIDANPLIGGVQRSNRLINDGRLFFVKVSYLFRF